MTTRLNAADEIGRTQAALSQQVKRLEEEVQQTLMIAAAAAASC